MPLSIKKVFVALLSVVTLLVIGLLSITHVGPDEKDLPESTQHILKINKKGQNNSESPELSLPSRELDGNVYLAHVNRLKLYTNTSSGRSAYYKQSLVPTPPFTMEQILTSRRTTLQEMCSKEFNNSVKTKGRAPSFFYSKSAKVACCKAPKTGSSFWGTVVLAIESRKNASDTFHINRNSVHGRNEIDVKKFRNITRESLTLMVSREPYSRLFSAFVDKYFLLGQLGREIQKALKKRPFIMNGGICGYGVTFTDFLNYITDRALRGMELNEHFMPIVKLCDACTIKYDVLSKQESLTKDTEHILDLLKFSDEKKNDIQTSLKKGIKNTIYSLVASYLTDYSKYRTDCPDRVSHFEKVWKTLQVQGYVSTRAAYPAGEFQKMTTFDADTITSLILKEMERFPLRKEEKAVQRKSALSIAYADVGPETIAKIQKVYKMDFLLFGYNMTPPDKRPGAITL